MKPKTDIQALELTAAELESISGDSSKYPQLRLPARQHERLKNLLFDMREYINKHPHRSRR